MKRGFFLVFFCLFFFTSVFSQLILDSSHHRFRAGDWLIKQQVSYADPGIPGRGLLWDFSSLETVDEDYGLLYYHPSQEDTLTIVGREHDTSYCYQLGGEFISLKSYSNRKVKMEMLENDLFLYFPLQYGDTLSRAFSGQGAYFREHPIVASGRTYLTADATGCLITPAGDTLQNVLRVSRQRIYDNTEVEGTLMKLEAYSWYAPGYRYPIFESYRSLVLQNDEEHIDFVRSFYYPPAAMESLANDPENEVLREKEKQDTDILLYCGVAPNPVSDYCNLTFELSSSARVTIQICDVMGNLISSLCSQQVFPMGFNEKSLPVTGLRPGNYVLHIQAEAYVKRLVLIKI